MTDFSTILTNLKKGENLGFDNFMDYEYEERICKYCECFGDQFDLNNEEYDHFCKLKKKVYWCDVEGEQVRSHFVCGKKECFASFKRQQQWSRTNQLKLTTFIFNACKERNCLGHVEKDWEKKSYYCKKHCSFYKTLNSQEKKEETKKEEEEEDDCIILEVRKASKRKLPWNDDDKNEHWYSARYLPYFFEEDKEEALKKRKQSLIGEDDVEEEKEREIKFGKNVRFVYYKGDKIFW